MTRRRCRFSSCERNERKFLNWPSASPLRITLACWSKRRHRQNLTEHADRHARCSLRVCVRSWLRHSLGETRLSVTLDFDFDLPGQLVYWEPRKVSKGHPSVTEVGYFCKMSQSHIDIWRSASQNQTQFLLFFFLSWNFCYSWILLNKRDALVKMSICERTPVMYSISQMKAHSRRGFSLRFLKLRYESPEHPRFVCHVVLFFTIPIAKLRKDQGECRECRSALRTRSPSPYKRIKVNNQKKKKKALMNARAR